MPARRSKTWRASRSEPERSEFGEGGERRLVGHRAPQERGDVVLLDVLQARRDAGLAEIFLGEDVARDLAPGGGHVDLVELEDDRAVGVPDLALGRPELDALVGAFARFGISPLNSHLPVPLSSSASRACHPPARILLIQDSAPPPLVCRPHPAGFESPDIVSKLSAEH